MKSIFKFIFSSVAVAFTLASCNDTTGIGQSLVQDEITVVLNDSSFTLTGRSVLNERVPSRTVLQLLGCIDAKGFGRLSSEIVAQFMPSNELITEGVTEELIDSLHLLFTVPKGAYIGDSIAPMGLEVYLLNKQLPLPIFSNFDPAGYYEPTPISRLAYTTCGIAENDTVAADRYRYVEVELPVELGKKFFRKYVEDPAVFSNPEAFAEFFPGLYVRNSFGSGRIIQIAATEIDMYYRQKAKYTNSVGEERDTVYNRANTYFAITPEVIFNNDIKLEISEQLEQQVADGKNLVIAPAGREVEIKFPIKDIIDYYIEESGPLAIVNTLSVEIPAATVENDYEITPPNYLLMVLSDKKDKFFETNSITDNETSFYATYDSSAKSYTFTGFRQYFLNMLEKHLRGESIAESDYTFTITPVEVTTEQVSQYSTATYISSISPMVHYPAIVELDVDKSKITFVFSRQTIKN